jgi:predicted MFS family arabinose efflux permease
LAATGLVWIAAWLIWFREPEAHESAFSPGEIPRGPAKQGASASSIAERVGVTNQQFPHPHFAKDGMRASPPGRGGHQLATNIDLRQWWVIARRTVPATAVNFCYGWTLWLFLTWIPSFFVQNYHLSLTGSALFSAGVFLGGLIGDALGGMASDRILRRSANPVFARRRVIVAGFLGGCACLFAVMFSADATMAALMLSLAFFFAELIVAPMWAVIMDIEPLHPGLASGIMNFGSAIAGIVSPLAFGLMVDATGSWTIPFGISVVLLLLGAALTFTLHPQASANSEWQIQLEATSRAGGGAA